MHEHDRYFEWLPFLVNGSLRPEEREWMRRHLARYPGLRSQLAFTEAVRRVMREQVSTWMHNVPADVGYARVARHISAKREQRSVQAPRAKDAPGGRGSEGSIVHAIRPWFEAARRGTASGGWRLAQGAVLGVAAAVIVLPPLHAPRRAAEVRGVVQGWADEPLLRATFAPAATETQMRLALLEAGTRVVAGPTRLGDYYLKPPAGRLEAARDSLQRSGLVRQIDPVPGVPAEVRE